MASNHNEQEKPVRDDGLAPRKVPFRAGGKQQGTPATRKASLLDSGPGLGYVPGSGSTGSNARAGGVDEAPRESARGPMQYGVARPAERPRPMPREIPVQTQTTHFGNITRYLDGHSEITRERPGLVEMMNNPDTHPDDKRDIQTEITHRDAINNHKYW
jgi:hypothetical protein